MLRLVSIVSILSLPMAAYAAAPRTFKELADLIVSILDGGTALLVLGAIVIYFWGISTNLLKMKDEGGEVFKRYFFWGIVAIFVMVSVWGITNLLRNTLFGGNVGGSGTSEQVFIGTSEGSSFPSFE